MDRSDWNILLIEDDEEDYILTRGMLHEAQRGKYRLRWVNTYDQGLEALRAGNFDAALIDYQLGPRSGIDLIRAVPADSLPGPLLLLTGHGDYETDLEAMQAGAVDYLTKSDLNPILLERSIRFAIERYRIAAELTQANQALQRANHELQQERARLHAVVQNAPSGIVLTDREGNFLLTNPAADALFFGGISGNAAQPGSGFTLLHSDGRLMEPDERPLVQALKNIHPRKNTEIRVRSESGEEHTILSNSAPIIGENGELEGAVAVLQDITHRKRIELERERLLAENLRYQNSLEQQRTLLEQQNNLLEQIVEYAPAGIALLQGDDYQFTMANPAYQAIARGKGDLVGRTLLEVWPEIYDTIKELFDLVEETGEPLTRQNQLLPVQRGIGQEEAYFTFTFSPLFDDYGAVEGIMVLVIETTAQVLAQHRIEAERAWLETVVQELPVAVWIADTNGKILLANRAVSEILGGQMPLADSIEQYNLYKGRWAHNGRELLPEEWALARAVRGERVPLEEIDITQLDGLPATMLASGAPIVDASGKLLGGVAVAQDITSRKALEDAFRARERALRRSEERNRQMLNTTFEGVWTLDEEGTTLAINERGAEILGYTIEEMIGQPFLRFFSSDELDQRLSFDQSGASTYREWRVQHKDGSAVWILTSAAALATEDGSAEGALIMFSDITERKRSERQSRFLNELSSSLMLMNNPDELIEMAVQSAGSFFDVDFCRLDEMQYSAAGDLLWNAVILADYRSSEDLPAVPNAAFDRSHPLSQQIGEGRPLIIDDIHTDPLTREIAAVFDALHIRGLVAYPYMPGDRWIGTLWLASAQPRSWKADELAFVRALTDLTWQAITRARYFQDLHTLGERFRVALSQIPVTVFTLAPDLQPVWKYDAYQNGHSQPNLLADPAVIDLLQEVKGSGQALQREIMLHGGGVYVLTVEPLRDDDGALTGMTGAALNVTSQRRMEARQAEYSTMMEVQRRLLEQREMERQQIARDLHDGPIQDTMGLIFALQAATDLTRDSSMITTLAEIRESATRLVSELRGVTNELRPPVLARFGLERAIRAHAHEFQDRNPNLQLGLRLVEDGSSLPEDVRLAVYRIYQESLNNVVRHSEATSVLVRLEHSAESVLLEVEDNGKGFHLPGDWLELARTGHLGLVGMKERADAIGATLVIDSTPNQGTRITLYRPGG